MKIKICQFTILIFVSILLNSCGPTSSKDYQTLAISEMNSFTLLLKKINDPCDLKKNQKKIKAHFNDLSKIMIDYRTFLEKHPEASEKPSDRSHYAAAMLKEELYRIYELDGATQILEDAQKDAYIKVSLFEHSLTQEKIDMFKSNKPLF